MRILILAEFAGLWDAPGGLRHLGFSRCWVRSGHEVVILTAALSKEQKGFVEQVVDGVRVVSVPMGSRDPVANNKAGFASRITGFAGYSLGTLLAWRRIQKSDVIIVSSPPLTACLGGVLWAQVFGKPIVFEIRDLWPDAAVQLGNLRSGILIRFGKWIERRIRSCSEHVVALSPGLKSAVISLGEQHRRVSVIPNSCDHDMLDVGERRMSETIWSSCPDGPIKVLYAGTLGRANAIDLLMEALAWLGNVVQEGEIQVEIRGDGKFRPDLEAFASRRGFDWLRLNPVLPRRKMAEQFGMADISLVLFQPAVALRHGSPNKLFDSIACGCPVLVNTDGWMKSLVEQFGIGCFCEPGSGSAIGKALLGLRGMKQELREMGGRAFQLARTGFSRDQMAMRYESILKDVTGGTARQFDAFLNLGMRESEG